MIALSTIAARRADRVFEYRREIMKAMEHGSVITIDNGVAVLSTVASTRDQYRREILPYLLRHLETCRQKDVPQHAEKTLVAIDASYKDAFIAVLTTRTPQMTSSQLARVRRVIQMAQGLDSQPAPQQQG
jgi:hypothetical protein